MWRFKFLLIGMLISGAIGVGLFFVGRYVYDEFRQELEDDAVAAVGDYFATNKPAPITQERIAITERELTQALRDTDGLSSAFDEQGLEIDLVPGQIRLVDADREGDGATLASVSPTIVNAEIELGEPGGVVGILIPMRTIADEIESQLLSYFNENQVIPTSIDVTDRELILTVAPKPGTTLGATPASTPLAGARTPTPAAGVAATATPRRSTPAVASTPRPAATATRSAATATATPDAGGRTPTAEPTATRTNPPARPRTLTPTPATRCGSATPSPSL